MPTPTTLLSPVNSTSTVQTANVGFVRPEIAFFLDQYYLIRDCIAGETAIKKAGEKYLPMPNADDKSRENKLRYEAYLKRAVFYNVTRHTVTGLLGQVFMRDPEIEAPTQLQSVVDDATGSGVSLIQVAKEALSLALAYSRGGLFVDYPRTATPFEELDIAVPSGGTTVAQLESGEIRPTISVYGPFQIINWRVIERGAKEILSLVVLAEGYPFDDDGFQLKHALQYRVLKLENGIYTQQIWREQSPSVWDQQTIPTDSGKKPTKFNPVEAFTPLDQTGAPMTEIPFSFFGSQNNDSSVDDPNLYDLCSLNVAHYRNSADYEESCYIVGQPTPVVTGLTQEWYEKVLDKKINFGSRGGVPLPAGADMKLVQAVESTMLKEAMETKESQMIKIGAKLVSDSMVEKTAFEARVDATAEGSVLSTTTKNVASALTWALQFAANWSGVAATCEVELNTEFDLSKSTPEERQEVVKEWQAGAITFEEMRAVLRSDGIATEDDAAAQTKIENEQAKAMQQQVDLAGGTAAAVADADGSPVESSGKTGE